MQRERNKPQIVFLKKVSTVVEEKESKNKRLTRSKESNGAEGSFRDAEYSQFASAKSLLTTLLDWFIRNEQVS